MTIFGFFLIVTGFLGIRFHGYAYIKYRQIKKAVKSDGDFSVGAAPFIEYNASMFWMACVCVPAGYYLALVKSGDWLNVLGLIIGLYGVSGFIQSFRVYDTMNELIKAGRDLDSLQSSLWSIRMIGIICISLGVYLFL